MSEKKRSLGKGLSDLGLSELLGGSPAVADKKVDTKEISPSSSVEVTDEVIPPAKAAVAVDHLNKLGVDQLKPGRYQPRRTFSDEKLQELADSIKSQGIIQPIVVRRMNDGYEIIAGERRWRAAQLAGLGEVPVIVRDLSDDAALAMSLIENIQRQDLNVIEEAVALDRLLNEFNLTHQEIAESVGKSRTSVTNTLRLLKLNIDVRLLLEQGRLDMGHARCLLSLQGLAQSEMAQRIVNQGLSVRQTEQLVKRTQQEKTGAPITAERDPNIIRLQDDLSQKLSAKVLIKHQPKGAGQLVVSYHSLDELEGILDHIS